LDAAACPGSGKTTLVVAKLAILARKWATTQRGICVLSHTNVARQEIEKRLGHTSVGQALLHYPHCIDTIHGFVSRYLAMPFVRSQGGRVTAIDDEMTFRARKRQLNRGEFRTLDGFLQRKHFDFERLRFKTIDGNPTVGGFGFAWGGHTDTFQLAKRAVLGAAAEGYFCYDEIFVLAAELLREQPLLSEILSQRFPIVIIDEMQDTSDQQGQLLHQVFPRTSESAVVQRVGDPNQAIFEGGELFTIDQFPDAARCLHIADSHRFDSSIAGLANPFARNPILPDGLRGVRDAGQTTIPHHLLIFPDGDTTRVLGAFGERVLAHFTPSQLSGSIVAALGAVHAKADDILPGNDKYPKSVCHYWSDYSPNTDRKDPSPEDLAAYFHHARRIVGEAGALGPSVDHVARGIIHLANLTAGKAVLQPASRPNLQLARLLGAHPDGAAPYRNLLARFVVNLEPLDSAAWASIRDDLKAIATALTNSEIPAPAAAFLNWSLPPQQSHQQQAQISRIKANVYRHSAGASHVDIQLSSIHRAKGQTHLATLVLETFNYNHFLKSLLPWLAGQKIGGEACSSDREIKRLLQMYVAVTRPSHLLCLAMSRSSFGYGATFERNSDHLTERGWTLQLL
jgi:superfamily I DNA/RNA helicase